MPLTANQRTAFFEAPDQMGIPHAMVAQLHEEGIDGVEDLTDFDKDTIEQIASTLRRPSGRAPDHNPGAAAGATVSSTRLWKTRKVERNPKFQR